MAAEAAVSSPETLAQRIDVLTKCAQGFRGIVVVPYSGVRRLLPAPEVMAEAQVTVSQDGTLALDEFLMSMIEMGYERVERVENRGELSVRGGIIDFYPMTSPLAYRVELFDDEVDSIRTFDPVDQRSIDKVRSVKITPAKEIIASRFRQESASAEASVMLERQLEKMADRQAKLRLKEEIGRELEMLREGTYFPEIYKYISLLYPERSHLFDYMAQDTILILDEPTRLLETAKQLERDESEWNLHLMQNGKTLPDLDLSVETDVVMYKRPFQSLFMSIFCARSHTFNHRTFLGLLVVGCRISMVR